MIVEFKEQIAQFVQDYKNNDVIITPLYSDNNLHVNMNRLCALHIKILNKKIYYLLPFNHSECNNLSDDVLTKLNIDNKKYIYNKKRFIQLYEFKNLIDIESLYYLDNGRSYEVETVYNPSQNLIANISDKIFYINEYTPVVKLLEYLNEFSDEMNHIISTSFVVSDAEYKSIDLPIRIFSKIEKNGICVDRDKLKTHFPIYTKYTRNSNIIYSEYNLYTLTGRPANSYLKMNFAALNKSNGERECIISRFEDGNLLYLDYSAYHLNVIAKIINYKFPDGVSVHEYLGKFYFDTDNLTDEEYENSKKLSFKFLYGGIPKGISDNIPFFKQVDKLIEKLYTEFRTDGFIRTHFFKRKLHIDPNGLTRNKVFNYYIQSLETEFNIRILHNLNTYLQDKKSKLILYMYDGFLFDVHPDEIGEIDLNVSNIISDDAFTYTKFIGKNFQNMEKI